jgi:8-oxo-dGTP pyrophosphatase MutT (NUDIX family)
MRDRFPIVVHTLLLRAGEVLLLRRAGTGYLDGWYALPGGHLQRGEGVVACAMRELQEETGLTATSQHMLPAVVMPYRGNGEQGVNFVMRCDEFRGEPWLAEPDKFDAIGWWRCDALPTPVVPYLARALAMSGSGDWFYEAESN